MGRKTSINQLQLQPRLRKLNRLVEHISTGRILFLLPNQQHQTIFTSPFTCQFKAQRQSYYWLLIGWHIAVLTGCISIYPKLLRSPNFKDVLCKCCVIWAKCCMQLYQHTWWRSSFVVGAWVFHALLDTVTHRKCFTVWCIYTISGGNRSFFVWMHCALTKTIKAPFFTVAYLWRFKYHREYIVVQFIETVLKNVACNLIWSL